MTHTISGTLNTLVTLNSAIYNPTTITATGLLNDGIEVSYAGLSLVNAGSISAFGTAAPNAGVDLLAGGTVSNQSGGSIEGYIGIYGQNAAVTVVNAGHIAGYYEHIRYPGAGVDLLAGGSVTNQSGGSIYGNKVVIDSANIAVNVVNYGGLRSAGYGVRLYAGGNVTNQAGGSILGAFQGIRAFAAATVVNAGSITTYGGGAVELDAGGSVTNQNGGTIHAAGIGYAGVDGFGAALTVTNAGAINGAYYGVLLHADGSVVNQQGGTISGPDGVAGALTVVNAGSIIGTPKVGYGGDAVAFAGGNPNRLVVDPTAVFSGIVDGGNTIGATAVSTLELAGATTGTLSGIGTQFVNFAETTVDAGAYWTLAGANTLAAGSTLTNAGTLTMLDGTLSDAGAVVNNGVIQIDPSTVTLGSLTGTGTTAIGGGSTLDILGSVAVGETIVFNPGGDLLGVDPTVFSGQVDGFIVGDTIALTGVTDGVSAGIVNTNTLQVERSAHPAADLTLDPSVDYTGDRYAVSPDGVVTETPCFLNGTLIRTERGEVAVQDLAIGDHVVTLSGQTRPVTWIGTGRVLVTRGQRCAATPIIVRKGALADNVPYQDLHITKGHCLCVDRVLIPAEFLINHRSILWDDHQQTVSFYHIELATHDVLIANGAAAESYRDDGNRWLFENANSGWGEAPKPPCAPVLTGGAMVDAIWRRLLDRAGPRRSTTLIEDPDLHVLLDGSRLDAAIRSGNLFVFNLPRTRGNIRVASRAAAPQELGLARDTRCLGVALGRIVVRQKTRFRVIEAADGRLTDGFHAFESAGCLRWTDGDATLPTALFDGFDGAVELLLELRGSTRYPAFAGAAA